MQNQEGLRQRTRNGCWTCRKRKKKCDETGNPCEACKRLGLKCETKVRLVWEDDQRRIGMKRRGPPSLKPRYDGHRVTQIDTPVPNPKMLMKSDQSHNSTGPNRQSAHLNDNSGNTIVGSHRLLYQQISSYPRRLQQTESMLLSHYVERFSRTYPTHSGPNNPFLTVLLPLAMKSEVVLDSILALSGTQRWDNTWGWMYQESLKLKQRALRGCRSLLDIDDLLPKYTTLLTTSESVRDLRQMDTDRVESLLSLLTTSVLLLLCEKISGEPNWRPHMQFIGQVFNHWGHELLKAPELSDSIHFLHDIFVYNDLVRSTSLRARPISDFYLSTTQPPENVGQVSLKRSSIARKEVSPCSSDRYSFPNLIARIGAGDETVDEAQIATWDGRLDWLPSFALDGRPGSVRSVGQREQNEDVDHKITSDLYRVAAKIYRLQVHHQNNATTDVTGCLSSLAAEAHSVLINLPQDSVYANALLWPLGIAAKELTERQSSERQDVLARLQALNDRFQMVHFSRVQDLLIQYWTMKDTGTTTDHCTSTPEMGLDSMLLG